MGEATTKIARAPDFHTASAACGPRAARSTGTLQTHGGRTALRISLAFEGMDEAMLKTFESLDDFLVARGVGAGTERR
jgi:hypothetical protein